MSATTAEQVTDGAGLTEQETITVDADQASWRLRCPAGHSSWTPTNSHVWCYACAQAAENGADVEPEVWELFDQVSGELVHWSRIEIEE